MDACNFICLLRSWAAATYTYHDSQAHPVTKCCRECTSCGETVGQCKTGYRQCTCTLHWSQQLSLAVHIRRLLETNSRMYLLKWNKSFHAKIAANFPKNIKHLTKGWTLLGCCRLFLHKIESTAACKQQTPYCTLTLTRDVISVPFTRVNTFYRCGEHAVAAMRHRWLHAML